MSSPAAHSAKLVRMANQIATFFRTFPHEEAVAGVREHITAFWSPAMRRDLRDALDGADVDPLVAAAMRAPATGAPSPVERETAGPAEAGQLGAADTG